LLFYIDQDNATLLHDEQPLTTVVWIDEIEWSTVETGGDFDELKLDRRRIVRRIVLRGSTPIEQ
jgi:hypothetical protein